MPRKIDKKTAAAVFQILAKYQAIETSRQGIRPDMPIEVGGEERYQLTSYDRLKAIAINRNLNRSNSKALTIIGNRCVLAFGKVKARFASSDENWNKIADEYFNVDFARDCRYDEPQHFAELVQGIERALMLEGDVLVSFDDWLADTGKLLIWEADQLCEVAASDWEKNAPAWARDKEGKAYPQKNGVIRSKDGRLAGFIVCRKELAAEKSGVLTVGIDEATFIPEEAARLIKNRFRFNQSRGVPSMLPVSDNLYDIDEMVKSELSTARVRSKNYAYVEHTDPGISDDQQALAEDLLEKLTAEAESGEGDDSGITEALAEEKVKELPLYDQLKECVGGNLDYVATGDKVVFPGIDRPNLDTATFFNELGDSAAASQGLTQGFARMAVSSSYTAHRGECAITYAHLRNFQKRMEHQFLDWVAEKVIRRGLRRGLFPLPSDPRWNFKINWEFPAPDAIDPEKQARANMPKLKNGELTFRELLGPGWKSRLADLAEECRYIRSLGLPLNIFETVAGAAAVVEQQEE